jgi:limonene-1,2-epoxide hydrolase
MKDTDQAPDDSGFSSSRRNILTGAAAAGLTACGGDAMTEAKEPVKNELEIANETVVNNFCRDWALRDIEALRPYLAEDLYYQITPGQPIIESRDQFEKQMGAWLKSLESVRWEILRSHVIGQIVINERIDHFNAPEGAKMPSMRFHIVGDFLLEDGVIKVWKDWPIPGAKQIIG